MIDLTKERAYTLNAARGLPEAQRNERRLDVSALYRWTTRGITRNGRTIRLETVQQAGAKVTTREAIARFFAALSGEHAPAIDHPQQHKQAERELEAAGI